MVTSKAQFREGTVGDNPACCREKQSVYGPREDRSKPRPINLCTGVHLFLCATESCKFVNIFRQNPGQSKPAENPRWSSATSGSSTFRIMSWRRWNWSLTNGLNYKEMMNTDKHCWIFWRKRSTTSWLSSKTALDNCSRLLNFLRPWKLRLYTLWREKRGWTLERIIIRLLWLTEICHIRHWSNSRLLLKRSV